MHPGLLRPRPSSSPALFVPGPLRPKKIFGGPFFGRPRPGSELAFRSFASATSSDRIGHFAKRIGHFAKRIGHFVKSHRQLRQIASATLAKSTGHSLTSSFVLHRPLCAVRGGPFRLGQGGPFLRSFEVARGVSRGRGARGNGKRGADRFSVFQSSSLSVSLSVFQSSSLSVFQSFCLSVFLFISLSVYQSVCLSVCLFISQSVFQSFCLSVFLPVFPHEQL